MNEDDREPKRPSAAAASPFSSGVVVGWLDPSSNPHQLCVDYPDNTLGPIRARATIVLEDAALARAISTRQGALLVFENGNPALPIIIGLIQTPAARLFDALLAQPREASAAPPEPGARLDGDSVVFEGKREVVLKSGAASLTLRRDGKVLIRGEYVETLANGINRIKGGAVKIN